MPPENSLRQKPHSSPSALPVGLTRIAIGARHRPIDVKARQQSEEPHTALLVGNRLTAKLNGRTPRGRIEPFVGVLPNESVFIYSSQSALSVGAHTKGHASLNSNQSQSTLVERCDHRPCSTDCETFCPVPISLAFRNTVSSSVVACPHMYMAMTRVVCSPSAFWSGLIY